MTTKQEILLKALGDVPDKNAIKLGDCWDAIFDAMEEYGQQFRKPMHLKDKTGRTVEIKIPIPHLSGSYLITNIGKLNVNLVYEKTFKDKAMLEFNCSSASGEKICKIETYKELDWEQNRKVNVKYKKT